MPTDRSKNPRVPQDRPWHARVKFQTITYSLGYYATRDEAQAVEDDFRAANGAPNKHTPAQTAALNKAILALHAKGLPPSQIANQLGCHRHTVKNHLHRARKKALA